MTNDEIRRNDEIRMTKPATAQLRVLRHSGFGFLSSFVIQRFVQVRFMVPMHGLKVVGALHEPKGAAGRETGEKHCRQDAGSTLSAQSQLFEVRRPSARHHRW